MSKEHTKRFVLFDAHNHIHLSFRQLQTQHNTNNNSDNYNNSNSNNNKNSISNKYDIPSLMNQQQHQQNEQTNENIHSFPFLFELSKESFESLYNLSINIIHSLFVEIDDKDEDHEEVEEEDEKEVEEKIKYMSMNGMALMSTQPRDYLIVEQLSKLLATYNNKSSKDNDNNRNENDSQCRHIIPCFGVHPWFLKDANKEYDQLVLQQQQQPHQRYQQEEQTLEDNNCDTTLSLLSLSYQHLIHDIHYNSNNNENNNKNNNKNNNNDDPINIIIPSWLQYLHDKLYTNPQSHVGEIGLDSARYDNPITKEIIIPLTTQQHAFEVQLHLACHLHKSVSIHCVRCWGVFMDSLRNVKKQRLSRRKDLKMMKIHDDDDDDDDDYNKDFHILPPKIYMHAFGGNPSIVDQINAICLKDNPLSCDIYYGFAPAINFRSPKKTEDTIRKVGIHHLVLESDLEDYSGVKQDLESNVIFIANTLGLDVDDVVERTNDNAKRLYGVM